MANTEIDPESEPLLREGSSSGGVAGDRPLPASLQSPAEEDLASLAPSPFPLAVLVFRVISAATVVSALGCCASVVLLSVSTAQLTWDNAWSLAFQSYAAALALVTAFLEVPGPGPYISCYCQVLEPWFGRALLQFLVAVLTHTEISLQLSRLAAVAGAASVPATVFASALGPSPVADGEASGSALGIGVLLGNASVLAMTGCAMAHLVGGLMCAGQLKQYVLERRQKHLLLLQGLKELDERRANIRSGGGMQEE